MLRGVGVIPGICSERLCARYSCSDGRQ